MSDYHRISDHALIAYALRYLADDCDDHRPKTAARLRELAELIELDRDVHAWRLSLNPTEDTTG